MGHFHEQMARYDCQIRPNHPKKVSYTDADCKHNWTNEKLANAYCPSIATLYEVATSVKENVQEFIRESKKGRKFQEIEGITESVYHVQAGKQK